MKRLLVAMLVGMIRLYQALLSPILGPACRFEPSCSRYAEEAVRLHGPWKGSRLAFHRILRCRPGGANGFDPVPPASCGVEKTH